MNTKPDEMIRASAPVRLDFAGAWTDVAPFADEERGVVVNAAIDLRTRVELQTGLDAFHLRADDLDQELRAPTIAAMQRDGTLDLLKAAVRRAGMAPCMVRSYAEAPAGSGLGTSGALSVALTHAIGIAQRRSRDPFETAREAWRLETVDADVPGGQQDQFAAAFGGFQHLVFDHGAVNARPIQLDPEFADDLAAHTIICYTGRSRFSGRTISDVMRGYVARDSGIVDALHAMADIAETMVEALTSSDLPAIGRLLAANWTEQQRLAPGMRPPEMAQLEAAMLDAGAIGGKAAGAGAGGSMFFVVPGDVAPAVSAAKAAGATVLPTRWADRGVSTD